MLRRSAVSLAVIVLACGSCTRSAPPRILHRSSTTPFGVVAHQRWRLALPSATIGIPLVDADAILVTTADSVVALSHDGRGIWATPFAGTRIYAPRVDGDLVFVAGERALVALRRDSGDVVWRFDTGEGDGVRVNRPAVLDGVVVVTTSGGRVVGLERATGAIRWDTAMATESGAQVAVADGVAVVVGIAEWAAFDVATGARRWSGDLGLIGTSSPVIVPDDHGGLAVVATDDKLLAVGLRDGRLRWEASAAQSELAQVPAVTGDGRLLVPDHWGRLTGYRAADGKVLWHAAGKDGVALWGEPVLLGARLVAVALAKDGPRIASPTASVALRPPSPGLGVARLPDGGLVVSTYGDGQNYLVAYDLDVGAAASTR
jgi:outer membrane protein assembly factor BamB